MGKLNPSILAKTHTLEQINAKIEYYTDLIENSDTGVAGNKRYSLNTVQNSQSGESQDLAALVEILNDWLTAKTIKDGTDEGAKFYEVNLTR